MSQVKDFLIKVKNLLNKHQKWTKGEWSRTSKGTKTNYTSSDASRFCLLGACYKLDTYGTPSYPAIKAIETKLQDEGEYSSIPSFNDSPQTHYKDVINLLDEVIKENDR